MTRATTRRAWSFLPLLVPLALALPGACVPRATLGQEGGGPGGDGGAAATDGGGAGDSAGPRALVQCGGVEVDLMRDGANCGRCARDCTFGGAAPSAACESGRCTGVLVASAPYGTSCRPDITGSDPAAALALAATPTGTLVAFASFDGVFSIQATGGSVAVHSTSECQPLHLSATATRIAWTNYTSTAGPGSAAAVNLAAPTVVKTLGGCSADWSGRSITLAAASDVAFWGCAGTGGAGRVFKYTFANGTSATLGSNGMRNGVTSDGTADAWWGTSVTPPGGIDHANGAGIVNAYLAAGQVLALGFSASNVFWRTEADGVTFVRSIVRAPANDSTQAVVLATPTSDDVTLAVDAVDVCWSDAKEIRCVPNTGAPAQPETRAVASNKPHRIAMDSAAYYWTDASGGNVSVYRAAR